MSLCRSAIVELRCVHREDASATSRARIEVHYALAGDTFTVRFVVHNSAGAVVNESAPYGEPVWGLWETDVVEVFVACDAQNPRHYFEFQVSPLGQYFELEIFEPRKKMNREFRSGVRTSALLLSPSVWQADVRLSLESLGWQGDLVSLRAGAFACLGKSGARSYWSDHLPEQVAPDFHLPEAALKRIF